MKKPSSKIREEIARLQEQLKAAETREAERIGRVALKAGLGDIEIGDADLLVAFVEIAGKHCTVAGRTVRTTPTSGPGGKASARATAAPLHDPKEGHTGEDSSLAP
ncbi:TraC family protein [Mesorhizobium sp. CAU 1741]|uniref:TraC family protein n=1 Tax=Mesorhizobium sp. CAU 1741 TaxID=3140366 RepID=UPI00325B7D43